VEFLATRLLDQKKKWKAHKNLITYPMSLRNLKGREGPYSCPNQTKQKRRIIKKERTVMLNEYNLLGH
jgi:hypothetical protein